METSIQELKEILEIYTQEELIESLSYEANKNDLDGITENMMNDINDRIREYLDTIRQIAS